MSKTVYFHVNEELSYYEITCAIQKLINSDPNPIGKILIISLKEVENTTSEMIPKLTYQPEN
jgi:hypothetical protein